MPMIVDRRLDGRNKSAVNRQRLMRRYRAQIKKAVSEAVSKRSITDTDSGERINIPAKDVSEPVIHHGPAGRRETVHPGNKEFNTGDRIKRPPKKKAGGKSGAGQAADSGQGEDDFEFVISKEEYLDILFEELALPNLVKTKLARQAADNVVRAGFSSTGVPVNLNLPRTMRRAKGRKIAAIGAFAKRKQKLQEELDDEQANEPVDLDKVAELREAITRLTTKIETVPFIDTYDLKFNQFVRRPKPVTQAVMFCVMDVSGSMTEPIKEIAKRFFMLLYMFLARSYDKTDVVFIRHHTSAKEVDEEEFFTSRETGGTIVSSALKLTREIIDERFPIDDWNIYVAQASDGDNWEADSSVCSELLIEHIMPHLQYYAYVEIHDHDHQLLWTEYEKVKNRYDTFAMKQISGPDEIFPVFHELFKRRGT